MSRRKIALDSWVHQGRGGYWSEVPHPKIEIKKKHISVDTMILEVLRDLRFS